MRFVTQEPVSNDRFLFIHSIKPSTHTALLMLINKIVFHNFYLWQPNKT